MHYFLFSILTTIHMSMSCRCKWRYDRWNSISPALIGQADRQLGILKIPLTGNIFQSENATLYSLIDGHSITYLSKYIIYAYIHSMYEGYTFRDYSTNKLLHPEFAVCLRSYVSNAPCDLYKEIKMASHRSPLIRINLNAYGSCGIPLVLRVRW